MEPERQPIRMLVPINEAITVLGGIGRTTLYELIKNGHLLKVNIGRRGFITAESLREYVASLTEAAMA
jgi:hypothetical protein